MRISDWSSDVCSSDLRCAANVDQTDRTKKGFWVSADEIRTNNFDLSVNRYKDVIYAAEPYDPPMQILAEMKTLEAEITARLDEIENMLKEAGLARNEPAIRIEETGRTSLKPTHNLRGTTRQKEK